MSAAEKLKPETTNGERVASILSSNSPRFPGNADKVLAKAGYSVTRFNTLDEILISSAIARPSIVILEIDDETDIQQAQVFLRTQEIAIGLGRLKAVIFTSIKHQDIRKKVQHNLVADFLTHPLPDRTFVFKLDLQAKILSNVLEVESKRAETQFELHSAQERPGGRFNLKVLGPPPTLGGWHLVENTPQGKVRWRWIKKPEPAPEELEKEVSKRDWQYEGKEPPKWDDQEKLWTMESDEGEPLLEKIEHGQKTFSSKNSDWTAREVRRIRTQAEADLGVKRLETKIFANEQPIARIDRLSKDKADEKKELTAVTSEGAKNTNTTLDLSGSGEGNSPTFQDGKGNKAESVSFTQNVKSNLMDLRSRESGKSAGGDEENAKKDGVNNSLKGPADMVSSFAKTNKKSASPSIEGSPSEPKDQAAALREKFRDKSAGLSSHGAEETTAKPATGKREAVVDKQEPVKVPRETKTKEAAGQQITKLGSSPAEEKRAVSDRATPHTEAAAVVKSETAPPPKYETEEKKWNDRRPEGGDKYAAQGIRDRREEIAKVEAKQSKPTSPASPELIKTTNKTGESADQAVVKQISQAADETEVERIEAEDPNAEEVRLKQREQNAARSKKSVPQIQQSTRSTEEDTLVRVHIGEKSADDLVRDKAGPVASEEEIRIKNSEENAGARNERSPYRVVNERVHYIKSLEELGDDNSTWERVEIYRIYLSARKKYYGIETVEGALPLWVYIGESAPEFIEGAKSWKFYDNIPVKYTDVADLPEPVLNLLLELRKREQQRKLEALRKHGEAEGGSPENSEFQPEPPSGVPPREIKLRGQPDASATPDGGGSARSENRVTGVEHVRVETFGDKVISLLINLFRSGRK